MKLETKQRVHFIYGAALGILLGILAICFAVGCIAVYNSAEIKPYTYESIGRVFGYIAVPTVLTLVAIVGGIVIHYALPIEQGKLRPRVDAAVSVNRLATRTNPAAATEEEKAHLGKLRLHRDVFRFVCYALYISISLFSVIFCLVYSMKSAGLDEHGKVACIGVCALVLLAGCLVCGGATVARIITDASSYKEEAAVLREIMKRKGGALRPEKDSFDAAAIKRESITALTVRLGVSAVALTFIIVGACLGGMNMVFENAITLCKSCVGIG